MYIPHCGSLCWQLKLYLPTACMCDITFTTTCWLQRFEQPCTVNSAEFNNIVCVFISCWVFKLISESR